MNMPDVFASQHTHTTLVPPCSFPSGRGEVTEEWLRRTLAPHPAFRVDPIRQVELSDMGDGIGQLSALLLAEVTCRSGATRPMVIKLQAPVPEMHTLAMT